MTGRVLIVDDEPTFLAIAKNVVTSVLPKDVPLHTATDAFEALDLLGKWASESTPTLIITDYIMPEATGMDLIKEARIRHGNSPYQYACLTSVFHKTVLARTKQAGAVRAEVKPDSRDELKELYISLIEPWLRALAIEA